MREYMKTRREQSSNKAEKHSAREEKSKKQNNFSNNLSNPTHFIEQRVKVTEKQTKQIGNKQPMQQKQTCQFSSEKIKPHNHIKRNRQQSDGDKRAEPTNKRLRKGQVLENKECSSVSISDVISNFRNDITCGPEYVCTCCDQLWYRSSVIKCNPNGYKMCSQTIVESCLTCIKSVDNTKWICSTCHSNIKLGKLPSCAKANKMTFPVKPDILHLTDLEERLISPRIPFMQIRELPSGGQLSIHGNVVNVPANVNTTVNFLPRSLHKSQTIPIKLKRRLSFKHCYQFQNIRPTKVIEAAKYLINTSELYQIEGIQVADAWLDTLNTSGEWSEFVEKQDIQNTKNTAKNELTDVNESVNNGSKYVNTRKEDHSDTLKFSDSGNDSEDECCELPDRPLGVMDTMLKEPDVTECADNVISFAPREGNKPLGIFIDRDSEFLAFPSIYCGQWRADNNSRSVPVHYSTICKWELRSQDRKVAQCVPNIFFKLKKLQIKG